MSQGEGAQAAGAASRWFVALQGRLPRAGVVLAILFAFAWSAHWAWRRWATAGTSAAPFAISRETFDTPPLPAWIRTPLVDEVVRDGSLEGRSLLDPHLTIQVADAFRLHPWVRSVRRVSKRPSGRVEVDLEFRRPVALVEVTTPAARGVLPVDDEGVLLPRADFVDAHGQLLAEALAYPVIVAGDALPEGPAGTAWGDATVAGGARIAAAFGEAWRTCGLFKIAVRTEGDRREFSLLAKNGSRVLWGTAPGVKSHDQAAAKEKVERLVEYVSKHRPLEADAPQVEIDLRDGGEVRVAPMAAGAR